jgi:hypothetical protein
LILGDGAEFGGGFSRNPQTIFSAAAEHDLGLIDLEAVII